MAVCFNRREYLRTNLRGRELRAQPQGRGVRVHGKPWGGHQRLPVLHPPQQGPLAGRQTRGLRKGHQGNGMYHKGSKDTRSV